MISHSYQRDAAPISPRPTIANPIGIWVYLGDATPPPPAPSGTYRSYTPNNLNQITDATTSVDGATGEAFGFAYDANGNMTADAESRTYEWDAANRLIAINYTTAGARTDFTYDGLGHRIRIVETGAGVTATVQPAATSYTLFTTAPFTLPAGNYLLKFQGLGFEGGSSTFGGGGEALFSGTPIALLDQIKLNSTLIPSGSFESADVSSSGVGWEYNPSSYPWSFLSGAGIAANRGEMTINNDDAPDGTQVGFIQSRGRISQVWSAAAGRYTLSFKAAQSGSSDVSQRLTVSLRPAVNAVTVKAFVWCGNQICEERDANNSVKKRFFSEGEKRIGGADAGTYYYSRDHLGSVREVTNSAGTLKAQYDYDPFGKVVTVVGNMNVDFGFTGHYFHQPSRLNLAMYRAYNSSLGRWLSRDPIEERGGLNLYSYVENRPLTFVDRRGDIPAIVAIPVVGYLAYKTSVFLVNAYYASESAMAYNEAHARAHRNGSCPIEVEQQLNNWRNEILKEIGPNIANMILSAPGTTVNGPPPTNAADVAAQLVIDAATANDTP